MAKRILIVDDSATTRAMIKRTIKLAQVPIDEIYEARDGKNALETLDCVRVDLVLADLNMPEMDGFEMTRRLQANPATAATPVVVVSAEPSAAKFAASQPGVKGCLRKPFTPEELRSIVTQTLGVANA